MIVDILGQLCNQYGTDKGPGYHNYTRVYNQLFQGYRHDLVSLLEIGIGTVDAPSLHVWRDYFPQATIYGVDRKDYAVALRDEQRIIAIVDDATTFRPSDYAISQLDIVIDDGSHIADEYLASFTHLWEITRRFYVIEDILPADRARALNILERATSSIDDWRIITSENSACVTVVVKRV